MIIQPIIQVFLVATLHQSLVTSVINGNGRPGRFFGVALNGVKFAPAPATPFIFENTQTGEYNWDWVFEPTNVQGQGMGLVGLDCSSAHVGPQGYHYHGNMFEYVEGVQSGISTTDSPPSEPLHIGWASDGFPVLYRFGPDENGTIKELLPGWQLKQGNRTGDGISAPCGPYNGRYTADYEHVASSGDLDECNGVQRQITLSTSEGEEIFDYFYVITADFPQVPRCMVGMTSADFESGADQLTGPDADGDGFIEAYDCDDNDASINPNAAEIEGNDVDENCDGKLTTSIYETPEELGLQISPNPSSDYIMITNDQSRLMKVEVMTITGQLLKQYEDNRAVRVSNLPKGIYMARITLNDNRQSFAKIIIQ